MDKLTRKQLLKTDDAFISVAGEGAKWIVTHRLVVIAGTVALIGVVGGTTALVEYTRHRDTAASELLNDGQRLLAAQIVAADQADLKADPPTFATEKEKWQAAKAKFEKTVAAAGSSGVGSLARLYVADLTLRLGETDAAKKQLQVLIDSLNPDDAVLFIAVERFAYLQEAVGDLAGAKTTWGRLNGNETRFYADYATFHQARLLTQLGDVDKARTLYQSFGQRFKESPLRDRVRERLAALPPANPPVKSAKP